MPLRVAKDYYPDISVATHSGMDPMPPELCPVITLPAWIPQAVRLYLDHTEDGLSLRAIARRDGQHASTVMRKVRRYEGRRDDPLLDEALQALSRQPLPERQGRSPHMSDQKDAKPMSAPIRHQTPTIDEATILREGRRILRRLAEPGAVLALAPDMEKAVVMREFPDGRTARTAVVERNVAQAFALKDWISCRKSGRIASYELSATGRSALKRMMEDEEAGRVGMAEAAQSFDGRPFAAQHGDWGTRDIAGAEGNRRVRYNLAESPVAVLRRRRD